MIEVKYDDLPAETGWALRESAAALIACHSSGSFSTEGDAVVCTTYVAERAYTFKITNLHGDRICRRYGADEFKIIVNGWRAGSLPLVAAKNAP